MIHCLPNRSKRLLVRWFRFFWALALLGFGGGPSFAADVQINQFQDDLDPAIRGGVITYTLNVENSDIDTAHGVVLSLPLPAATTFVSATGGGTYSAGTVTWNLGDLLGTMATPAGVTHTVLVSIRTTGATGSTLSATATIATSDLDTLPDNNALTQTTTINNGADLRLVTGGSPDPVISGGNVTFTVDVTNLGPDAAAGGVTVTNTLPGNTTWVSSSGSGWTFSRTGQVVTCTRAASLASGASAGTISIVARVTAASGTVTNLATATSGTGDPDPNNNTATADVQVTAGADLSLTKTLSGTALSLQNVTFILHPRNLGTSSATAVTLTDTLPAGFTFVSASGTGWTCSTSGQVVTCTRASYAVGAADDITVVATAPEALTPTSYTNTATISSTTPDPSGGNDTGSVAFNLMPDGVDLSISKAKSPNPVAQGSPMASTLTVHNGGPRQAAANTITVTETLEDSLETYVSFTGTGWTYSGASPSGGSTTHTFTYTLALNSGSNANALRITTTATGIGAIANQASVAYSGTPGDWDLTNNQATASVTATATPLSPDLTITKSVSSPNADATLQSNETTLTYTLTVTNNGPLGADATGVVVTDVLPAFLTGTVSVSRTGGTSSATFNCTHSGATVTCTQTGGVIAQGETAIFTVTADRPFQSGSFTNTASVRSTTLGDPDSSNNSASAALTIEPIADVQVTSKTVSPDPVQAGTQTTYVVSVRNNGPSSAQDVVLTDTFSLPGGDTGFTLISVTPSKGTWSGLVTGQKYTGSPAITASIGTMASGEVQTLTVVIRPNWQSGTGSRTFSNTAAITTSTWENPSNTDNGNNSASATLTVLPAAVDVLVNVTDGGTGLGPDPLGYDPATPANNLLTYRVTPTNNGPSLASGITFNYSMTAPAGRTIRFLGAGATAAAAATNSLPICDSVNASVTGGTLVIHGDLDLEPTRVELASGASVSRYLAFRVESAPTPRDTYSSSVTIATNETDSNLSNNTASETTTVRTRADLAITKTPSVSPVQIRQPFYWTITVTNNGPGDAENTVVRDTLPAGMAFYAPGSGVPAPYNASPYTDGVTWSMNDASSTHGTGTVSGQSFTCAVGTLEVGKVLTVLVPVRITTYAATYGNTATITTDSVDPDSSNNSATGTVSVQRSRLSGLMYRDLNNNGTLDGGETAIASPVVNMRLTGTDAYGNAVSVTASTSSGGTGAFLLNNLSPADGTGYTLAQLTQPSGFWDGKDTPGTSGGTAVPIGATSISGIALAGNTEATDYLIGELPQDSISGYIYSDLDNDGVKDAGEPGISSAQVLITGTSFGPDGVEGTADDVPTMSGMTYTNGSGLYTFTPLYAGRYTIKEPQPTGYLDGKDSATWPGATVGSTAGVDEVSGIEMTSFGLSSTNNNFGELAPAVVRGTVFIDTNGDGAKGTGENAFINGVTVTLTGHDDLGQSVSLSQTTASGGTYAFTNLRPSDANGYTVTEEDVSALTHTGTQAGANGGVVDGLWRAANTGVAGSTLFAISAIPVTASNNATGYNFGEQGKGLSGKVYVDLDEDGLQDPGEPGLPGVRILLSGTTFAGQPIATAMGASACTATTDSNGDYTFPALPASDGSGYTLTEDPTSTPLGSYGDGQESLGTLGGSKAVNDRIAAIPLGTSDFGSGYDFAELGGSLGGRVYLDVNRDGSYGSGDTDLAGIAIALSGTATGSMVTAADGTFRFNGLPAGTYTLTETQPLDYASATTTPPSGATAASGTVINAIALTPGGTVSGASFGEKTEHLGGLVYLDSDNDGVKDPTETGIGGVSVRLTGRSAGGSDLDATTVTLADGSYGFVDLPVADASGYRLTETQPSSYLDGRHSAGSGGGNVSVANRIDAIPFNAASTYTSYNFGEVQGTGVAGGVYYDADNDGVLDAGEALSGVSVTLTGTDDQGATVSLSTTTATDGTYAFANVRPSGAAGYVLTETQPTGIGDYPSATGTQVGDLGGTAALNQITGIVLASGQSGIHYNFREIASTLSGFVYVDTDDDGVMDGGEPGIPGVTVTLSGDASVTTTTAADGSYAFLGLLSGTYTLTETHPVIYRDGKEAAGSPAGTVDNGSFTLNAAQNRIGSIALPVGTAGTGYLFGERPLAQGSFSGRVWFDLDHDRVKDSGEPDLAGWRVEVRQGGNLVRTTTTGASGAWTATGLAPNSGYEIRFRHPSIDAFFGDPVSQDSTYNNLLQSMGLSIDYSAHTIAGLLLPSGADVQEQNLPIDGVEIDPSGVVYDAITRLPVSGATVTITGPSGFNAAAHLLGGASSQSQVTDATGFYQFQLLPTTPAGTYTLAVNGPPAYVPGTSTIIPPATGPLSPGAGSGSYLVQSQASAPTGSESTTYYLTFLLNGLSASVANNHVPIDPVLGGALVVTKTSPKVNVVRGELVPYTIRARNTLAATLSNLDLVDEVPPGFKYVSGSARLDGVKAEPLVSGRTLRWRNLTFAANQTRTFTLVLVVGSGVGDGEYTNRAWALNNLVNTAVSNVGTATVRIVPDPTFDCTDIIGKVFDDRNANGFQDEGEPGLPNIGLATVKGRLITTDAEGRYHIPCAEVPQLDRGSNFILKLDERTLPSGYRMTTENPRVVRATRGKMVKLNFGAALHRVVRLEVSDAAFEGDALKPEWKSRFEDLPRLLDEKPSVIRLVYRHLPPDRQRAKDRLDALADELRKRWKDGKERYPLSIELERVEVTR